MQLSRTRAALTLLGLSAAFFSLAAHPASAQTHIYTLNNTYADSNGGPSLVNDTYSGGTGTLSASGYNFGKDQGLTLSNTISATDYSIDMTFSLTDLGGYKKLVDFKNLTSDNGLYLLNGQLDFYPIQLVGPTVVVANQSVDVKLTRNGATNLVTGYVNGVSQFSFTDTGSVNNPPIATFDSANNVVHFFEDDFATSQNEASGGTVTSIIINGGAPVPEASTTASFGLLLVLGLGGLAVAGKRRKA